MHGTHVWRRLGAMGCAIDRAVPHGGVAGGFQYASFFGPRRMTVQTDRSNGWQALLFRTSTAAPPGARSTRAAPHGVEPNPCYHFANVPANNRKRRRKTCGGFQVLLMVGMAAERRAAGTPEIFWLFCV